jgi:hypothetical protein
MDAASFAVILTAFGCATTEGHAIATLAIAATVLKPVIRRNTVVPLAKFALSQVSDIECAQSLQSLD